MRRAKVSSDMMEDADLTLSRIDAVVTSVRPVYPEALKTHALSGSTTNNHRLELDQAAER